MRPVALFFLIVALVLPAHSQDMEYPVSVPVFPLHLQPELRPRDVGFFSPVTGPIALSEDARGMLEDAVFWNWMTIGGFGASTLAFAVTHGVGDKTVGGVMALVSVGFWSVSNFATAFTHRKISVEIKNGLGDEARPVSAGISSLIAGIIGTGAITAVSLAFDNSSGADDPPNVAEITAYICFGLSAAAGGYGVYKTFEYASAAGTDLSFF